MAMETCKFEYLNVTLEYLPEFEKTLHSLYGVDLIQFATKAIELYRAHDSLGLGRPARMILQCSKEFDANAFGFTLKSKFTMSECITN